MARTLMTNFELMDMLGIDYRNKIVTQVRIDITPDTAPTVTVWQKIDHMPLGEQQDTYKIQLIKEDTDEDNI